MPTTSKRLSLRRFEPVTPVSGPPVLLIHGFASDGYCDWVQPGWPDTLTASGRTVLIPDLPGHGNSSAPNDRDDALPSTLAGGMAELLTAEPAGSVDVIGYSLGARLAWELPGTSGIDVAHLVLGGISPVEPFAAVEPARILACAQGHDTVCDPLTEAVVGMVTGEGRDTRALVTCVDGLGTESFAPRTGELTVPTLFVAGEEDGIADGIDELAVLVPGSSLERVPGDHKAALHHPQFRRLATEFIAAS